MKLFVTTGRVSDYIRARAMASGPPDVEWLFVDRGHDADWLRDTLKDKKERARISGRKQRQATVRYKKARLQTTKQYRVHVLQIEGLAA